MTARAHTHAERDGPGRSISSTIHPLRRLCWGAKCKKKPVAHLGLLRACHRPTPPPFFPHGRLRGRPTTRETESGRPSRRRMFRRKTLAWAVRYRESIRKALVGRASNRSVVWRSRENGSMWPPASLLLLPASVASLARSAVGSNRTPTTPGNRTHAVAAFVSSKLNHSRAYGTCAFVGHEASKCYSCPHTTLERK